MSHILVLHKTLLNEHEICLIKFICDEQQQQTALLLASLMGVAVTLIEIDAKLQKVTAIVIRSVTKEMTAVLISMLLDVS